MKNPWRGNCYESAFEYVLEMHRLGNEEFVLVHGLPTMQAGGPTPGEKYCHAWVEVGDFVLDRTASKDGSTLTLPKIVYYELGQISEVVRYTFSEAARKVVESGHYGPWDVKFDKFS